MEKKAFSIAELTALVGIGRTALYAEIKAGRLVTRKVGRRTVLLEGDIDAWLRSLPKAAGPFPTPHVDNAVASHGGRQ